VAAFSSPQKYQLRQRPWIEVGNVVQRFAPDEAYIFPATLSVTLLCPKVFTTST
jgi:hypothetical protein